MNIGKEVFWSTLATLPWAGALVRLRDAKELDSKFKDMYLKIASLKEEGQKKVIFDGIGQIKLMAQDGSIKVNGVVLEALNKIIVDSEHGFVSVDGTKMYASQIILASKEHGKLFVTGTVFFGEGASVEIQKDAAIEVVNGARIEIQ